MNLGNRVISVLGISKNPAPPPIEVFRESKVIGHVDDSSQASQIEGVRTSSGRPLSIVRETISIVMDILLSPCI